MEFLTLSLAFFSTLALLMFFKLILSWWIFPILTHHKLKRCGFTGPTPNFPFGNIHDIKKKPNRAPTMTMNSYNSSNSLSHDIHRTVFPYFSSWQDSHGKTPHIDMYTYVTTSYL